MIPETDKPPITTVNIHNTAENINNLKQPITTTNSQNNNRTYSIPEDRQHLKIIKDKAFKRVIHEHT
ncbi:hypothetical protein ACQWG3_25015, partial [Salmonella enterica subsp. enterica serovar Infantis]